MKTATGILYLAAGEPFVDGLEPIFERCWLCGAIMKKGLPVGAFVKPTFTNFDDIAALTSSHVCPACIFSFGERSSFLAERVGKEKPQRMRNYSHIVSSGKWYPLSKADKNELCILLLAEDGLPELAVIAESGQKHIIFRARVNPPGQKAGWVQFEEQRLWTRQTILSKAIGIVSGLLDAGFSKKEIGPGRYIQWRVWQYREAWLPLEEKAKELRREPEWLLAISLAQKGESDGEIEGTGCRPAPRPVARDRRGVQESLPGLDLDPV